MYYTELNVFYNHLKLRKFPEIREIELIGISEDKKFYKKYINYGISYGESGEIEFYDEDEVAVLNMYNGKMSHYYDGELDFVENIVGILYYDVKKQKRRR